VHSLSALLDTAEPEYLPLVCCTASRQESEGLGDGYIQGAGDDSEGWAQGLTPEIFWRNRTFLLSAALKDNEDVPTLLRKLELDRAVSDSSSNVVAVYPPNAGLPIYLCALDDLSDSSVEDLDGIITCDERATSSSPEQSKEASNLRRRLWLQCTTGKHGSRSLRNELPRLEAFIKELATYGKQPRLLFACKTGKDLSVGMALTALCLYFDDDGEPKL
jgi:tRNA A64-2'-O-ribosylphosphate transferase